MRRKSATRRQATVGNVAHKREVTSQVNEFAFDALFHCRNDSGVEIRCQQHERRIPPSLTSQGGTAPCGASLHTQARRREGVEA
jgi:hypothetical protein